MGYKIIVMGGNVNSFTLFEALVILGIDHVVVDAINEHLDSLPATGKRQRKRKSIKVLDNDF